MTKLLALSTSVLLVGADQWIKAWAIANLAGRTESLQVIPGLFQLTYVENRGVAFGLLQGRTSLITVAVCAVLAVALYLILSGKLGSRFLVWTVSLIMAGGAGNLIDRVARGYVVDYLDFSALFGFPVFNLADCCVVAGVFLLLFYMIWQERRERKNGAPRSGDAGREEA